MHQSVWMYVMVFVGRVINNMLVTIKIILVNRGEKFKAAVLTMLQTGLFITITGSVLAGLTTDYLRIVFYIVGGMVGNYLGTMLEEKIALGISSLQVIVPQDNVAGDSIAQTLTDKLRDEGFGVTMLEGEGSKAKRDVLLLHLKRKMLPKAKAVIKTFLSNAVIIENEITMMDGGYIEDNKRRRDER